MTPIQSSAIRHDSTSTPPRMGCTDLQNRIHQKRITHPRPRPRHPCLCETRGNKHKQLDLEHVLGNAKGSTVRSFHMAAGNSWGPGLLRGGGNWSFRAFREKRSEDVSDSVLYGIVWGMRAVEMIPASENKTTLRALMPFATIYLPVESAGLVSSAISAPISGRVYYLSDWIVEIRR